MVKRLKEFFLVLLVVLLSAVFALQFGGGQAEGCTAGGTTYLARIYDRVISRGDYQATFAIGRFDRIPAESQAAMRLPTLVVDGLVDRTLLARAAREVGFDVTEDEVMESFVNDGVIMLTLGSDAPPYLPQGEIPVSFEDKDGSFNADLAKRYIQNGLRRSVGEFAEAQVDERLAEKMRNLVVSTVSVSDAEVWDEYVRENDKAKIKYVRFPPTFYQRNAPTPSESALRAWMAKNDDKLQKEYEDNKHRFTDLEKQVRSRHILVKSPPSASDADKARAKAKAESLRKRALAGANFAALAKKNSDDTVSAAKGGDLGYNPKGRMVQAFDDAQFAMKVGEVSDVVSSPFGFHVIKVEGVREGDVPVDEAKRELADTVYQQEWIDSRSQEAADKLLADWKRGDDETIEKKLKPKGDKPSPFAPKLNETSEFGRADNPIPGVAANELIEAVFEVEDGKGFPKEAQKIGREWIVFRVVERERPDKEAYDEEAKAQTRAGLKTLKEDEILKLYIKQLRAQAEADQALRINQVPTADGQS